MYRINDCDYPSLEQMEAVLKRVPEYLGLMKEGRAIADYAASWPGIRFTFVGVLVGSGHISISFEFEYPGLDGRPRIASYDTCRPHIVHVSREDSADWAGYLRRLEKGTFSHADV